ncbi:anaerobic benzoate catabolism transcriptional regulator [Anaerostipes caccae]|jgi:transcriptional regulator with XRE-family HTH domain|uniref:Anaerobic benzoate catabolism transcriptional regulator n=1 Tax=Anaerostipes caccae TaxID=105841 RepID=A0A6N2RS27_9FIRM
MANIEDCPGFETFGADVKAARQAKRISRKAMAEKINIDWRYLANIENDGAIPSLPVIIQLIKACGLPVERYFNPEIMREESEQRQRVSHKLKLCPEEYLPIIEGAIDGALKMEQTAKQKEDA